MDTLECVFLRGHTQAREESENLVSNEGHSQNVMVPQCRKLTVRNHPPPPPPQKKDTNRFCEICSKIS